jgi:hypothetical protein
MTLQKINLPNGGIEVTWDATCINVMLQKAPTPIGPWADLTNVTASPYILTPAEIHQFNAGYVRFRVIP